MVVFGLYLQKAIEFESNYIASQIPQKQNENFQQFSFRYQLEG